MAKKVIYERVTENGCRHRRVRWLANRFVLSELNILAGASEAEFENEIANFKTEKEAKNACDRYFESIS